MNGKLITCLVLLSVFQLGTAAHRGEGCSGSVQCIDTGLTCTGAKCYCYTDISEDAARFWACNEDQDCPAFRSNEKDLQSSVASEKDSDRKTATIDAAAKILRCFRSTECPLVPGFIGYCNVDRKEVEEEQ